MQRPVLLDHGNFSGYISSPFLFGNSAFNSIASFSIDNHLGY